MSKRVARAPEKCGWTPQETCSTSECPHWDWTEGCTFGKTVARAGGS